MRTQSDASVASASKGGLIRWAWRTAAWVATVATYILKGALRVVASTSMGKSVLDSSTVQYFYGLWWSTSQVFLQKLHMHHLDHIDFVGGSVKGLTVIVTGPTSGIGVETAAALARRGAKVVLACRNIAKGGALKQQIEADSAAKGFPRPHLEVRVLDLASIASVREFCSAWEAERRDLHILINNAGIYQMGVPREETLDGFESHMGANYLGHFLLTLSLLPALKRGAVKKPTFGARIVSVSSSVHMMVPHGISPTDPHLKNPDAYSAEQAYGRSKLAQILFTREIRTRLGPNSPVQALCVHPGMVLTEVTRTLPRWMQVGNRLIMGVILLTPMEGARATVYCATSPLAPKEGEATGGYFDADCRPMEPSKAAHDATAARWLWRWSAQQVGLPVTLDLSEV